MSSHQKQVEQQQANVFASIVYAAFATHFKVVLRSHINPGEDANDAAQRHWNENLPGIAHCWDGLVKGMLVNVASAQAAGELPAMVQTTAPPLPGLGGPIPGAPDPALQPGALARRLSQGMRDRQEAARAASPALDVPPGLAIGRETEDE